MAMSTISQPLKDTLEAAAEWAFQQFMRQFTVYTEAQTTYISTSPQYSRFGQHDQNVTNTGQSPRVTPNVTTINGTLLYAKGQPYSYVAPETRSSYETNKLRESFGTLRLKVDSTGYALLCNSKLVNVDGFDFKLISNARPHSVFGPPTRFDFLLQKVD